GRTKTGFFASAGAFLSSAGFFGSAWIRETATVRTPRRPNANSLPAHPRPVRPILMGVDICFTPALGSAKLFRFAKSQRLRFVPHVPYAHRFVLTGKTAPGDLEKGDLEDETPPPEKGNGFGGGYS